MDNLGYDRSNYRIVYGNVVYELNTEYTPNWVYIGKNYHYYWTMTSSDDLSSVWNVGGNGEIGSAWPSENGLVRPLLELNKSADITKID